MVLHKENYGLIYNDDGSLCVTLRKDDVPFEGVTSFAVETATTNYWNNDITDYAYQITSGDVTFENTVYNGRPALKCIVTGTDPYIKVAFKHSAGNINPGDTYTASIGVAALSSEITGLVDTAAYIYFTKTWFGGFAHFDHNWGKAGNRIYATYTYPTDDITTPFYACVFLREAGTFYLYDYQLEQKPFASSFVVGSRPTGRLYIPLDKLGFNPAADEWVIAYWKKPFGTHINGLTGYNITAIGYNSVDNSVGYIWWGKEKDSNTFRVTVVYNNQTIASAYSGTFDPNWYFNNWHFEVLIKTSDEIKYYVDGVLQCSLTLSYPLQTFTEGLYIGGYKNYPCNNLIANIHLAKYKPIWTEEYIKTLYNTKKPFAVPPRLPII